MTSESTEWINTAWSSILDQEYDEARRILLAIVEEKDTTTSVHQAASQRLAEVADAEECLATIAYLSRDYRQVIDRALQSITRSNTFRIGAHVLAAKAHASLGETELAASKLQIVISRSPDLGMAGVALAYLQELTEDGVESNG
jgi:hypothetical protein